MSSTQTVSSSPDLGSIKVGVVIPAYKCKRHILNVLKKMPSFVSKVVVVDDDCPEGTGSFVKENFQESRAHVIFHEKNGGVGAAVKTGYRYLISQGVDILVKVDGDDQMDLSLMHKLVTPIGRGVCDYTKGNRFFYPRAITNMPRMRIFGNAVLGFLTKISSGYYSIFDPTNGYTAISADILQELEISKVHDRYFFESDILFRLNLSRARVWDIPMFPIYKDETSNLNELRVIPTFLKGHFRNFYKRLVYNYFLRDFSVGSVFLVLGALLLAFGASWSLYFWFLSVSSGLPTTTGRVMIGVLPLVLGFQLILSFLLNDIAAEPRGPAR
ncbi:MAG: glycosyltransferase family 2 protein [Bdellovibrionales bacterium]